MAEVEYRKEGSIARITLNRPDRKNALANDMRRDLREAFEQANEDDEIRVVLLDAVGKTFCAGADVGHITKRDPKGSRNNLQRNAHPLIRAIYNTEKPVITSVRGACVGIGLSMALASDFIIASDNARFSCIFTRLGMAPDSGAVFFLTRLIGQMKARDLVYKASFFSAQDGHDLDIISRVVADDSLEEQAVAFANEYADSPTYAIAMAKKMFQMSLTPSLEQFLEIEALVQPQTHQTYDFKEGVNSFKEKRMAKFIGR